MVFSAILAVYCVLDLVIVFRLIYEVIKQQKMLQVIAIFAILMQIFHACLVIAVYFERGMGSLSWVFLFLSC